MKTKKLQTMLKAIVLALLPVLSCAIYLLSQGRSFPEISLAASEWNDELFYFKQTEDILSHGIPQGYFGFNESHALELSFAAWSPVLLGPWIVWGLIFGWNMLSPFLCNLVVYTVTMLLTGLVAKPSWKQTGMIALFFFLFTPNVRYIYSAMPEVTCFAGVILFYALAIGYAKQIKAWKLVCMFLLAILMTWMRPYLALLLLLPMAFLTMRFRKGLRWIGCLASVLILGGTMAVYAAIKHYLSAEYFTPLFRTEFVDAFRQSGIFAGIRYCLGTIYYKGLDFIDYMVRGVNFGLAAGLFFIMYLFVMAVLFWQSVADGHRIRIARKSPQESDTEHILNRGRLLVQWHLFFSFLAMLAAVLLMYKLTEGSKHLLTFIAAGLFVIAMMETKTLNNLLMTSIVLTYLFSYNAISAYDFQVPFSTEALEQREAYWSGQFAENMQLETENTPNYENTVLWVFSDGEGGVYTNTDWQLLYQLPAGYGISCCYRDYILEHFDTLKSRYLAVRAGGEIDEKCLRSGWTEVGRDTALVVYRK